MKNIILRIKNRQAATAYQSWRSYVERVKRERNLLKRAAGRMKNRLLSSAMLAWVDLVWSSLVCFVLFCSVWLGCVGFCLVSFTKITQNGFHIGQ